MINDESAVQNKLVNNYRDWKSWRSEDFFTSSKEESIYFEQELLASKIDISKYMHCFEIGFGNGHFAAWAISKGFKYHGSEINKDLLAMAISNNIDVVSPDLDVVKFFGNKKLDLIVAFDVIEHLTHSEILLLLDSCSKIISENGTLVLRLPSGDSPFARPIQYGDMTHKSIIGSSMINQLCINSGLQVRQIRSPVLPLFGLGFIKFIRRALLVVIRTFIKIFINTIFNDGQNRIITPNMIVVLEKIR